MDKLVLQVFTCRDVEMISSDLTSNLVVTTKKKGSGPGNNSKLPYCDNNNSLLFKEIVNQFTFWSFRVAW